MSVLPVRTVTRAEKCICRWITHHSDSCVWLPSGRTALTNTFCSHCRFKQGFVFRIFLSLLSAPYLGRHVRAASGLCLPAVPEGQTDPAGVPDAVLSGSVSGCWGGFSLRHLPDVHRLVPRKNCLVSFSFFS